MKKVPIIPTLLVAVACATMIALGLWQLGRAEEKAALIARFEANRSLSSEIAFPALAPVRDEVLFRRSQAMCVDPVEWKVMAGRGVKGASGFRYLAYCRTGAEGPGLIADMGIASRPDSKPDWKGGMVSGVITLEPETRSVFSRMFVKAQPLRPMLVAANPAPGLSASAPPSTDDVPNSHLAYAVQWLFFSLVAAVIYALALRRRNRVGAATQ